MFIYIMCTCKEGVLQSSCRILNRSGHSHVYVLEISKFPLWYYACPVEFVFSVSHFIIS